MLVGAYTEVEMSNCHPQAFAQAYISKYLVPVSNHVVDLHRRTPGLTRQPFIYADPYYEDRTSCLSPDEYGQFWQKVFLAAPGFSLIAPQDGVGAHNLSQSTVSKFLTALRSASHAAQRRFGVLVELFENYPVGSRHHQPDCAHRRAAPWHRIQQQLQREVFFVDDLNGSNEFTAWEFHSYLSPLPGPCDWAQGNNSQRNASDGLYQTYKRYVEKLAV